jgi:hypothetical protein
VPSPVTVLFEIVRETLPTVVIERENPSAPPRGLGRVSVCSVPPYGRSAGSDVQSSFEDLPARLDHHRTGRSTEIVPLRRCGARGSMKRVLFASVPEDDTFVS